mgnify:CR=1 FL=1
MTRVTMLFFFLMIRRPPRSTLDRSSAASDVYKRQVLDLPIQYQTLNVDIEPVAQMRQFGADAYDVANWTCLLYTSPSPRDRTRSRMPSSA